MMGPGMGFGMLAFMGIFFGLVFLARIARASTREKSFSPRKRKFESYDDEEEYFFPDEKPKRGAEIALSADGELLDITGHE